jgi:hypothetical protein
MRFRTVVLAALIACAPPAGLASSDDRVAMVSTWRTAPIRIDGNDEDWQGRLMPVAKQKFSVGVVNDGDALYLCLATKDRVLTTQIAYQGLEVWLDPAGSKKHVFGVHFPIDPRLNALRNVASRARDMLPDPAAGPEASGQAAIGMLGPGRHEATRVPLDQTGGIEARVVVRGDLLVYELKLPFRSAQPGPYALAADPGGSVSLELSTPEWRGALPPARGRINVGVAMPGPNGRGVVGYPAVDTSVLRPMTVKVTLHLAAAPEAGR